MSSREEGFCLCMCMPVCVHPLQPCPHPLSHACSVLALPELHPCPTLALPAASPLPNRCPTLARPVSQRSPALHALVGEAGAEAFGTGSIGWMLVDAPCNMSGVSEEWQYLLALGHVAYAG